MPLQGWTNICAPLPSYTLLWTIDAMASLLTRAGASTFSTPLNVTYLFASHEASCSTRSEMLKTLKAAT